MVPTVMAGMLLVLICEGDGHVREAFIGFDETDVFVDDNTPSYGGDGGWDQFSVDPEKSDI